MFSISKLMYENTLLAEFEKRNKKFEGGDGNKYKNEEKESRYKH